MRKQVFPDTYSVPVRIIAERPSTNPRYKSFTQTHFTAGDKEQFDFQYKRLELRRTKEVPLHPVIVWPKFNLTPESVQNTFQYVFFKFKKGIFLQIRNGQLVSFVPFSNTFFVNEWHTRVQIPPELGHSKKILPIPQWYTNNGLFRYESPCNETDTGVCQMKNMFETLCATYTHRVPDIDLYINRRDFPLLKEDATEPYHNIWDSETHPLVSHAYDTYAPLLSSCSAKGFADIPIPTMDDWTRVQGQLGIHFASSKRSMAISDHFPIPWNKKRELAVFRGTSTGMGTDPQTNVRIKLVMEFQNHPLCNVGLTGYNTRPRKIAGDPRVHIPQTKWVPLSSPMTIEEQASYKYIIHAPGHVQAYRLSIELATGSVILMIDCPYRLWFESLLVPWVHFVPVSADLSDLDDRLQWCIEHDEECQEIARQARAFYDRYLSRSGCLEYLWNVLVSLSSRCIITSPHISRANRLLSMYSSTNSNLRLSSFRFQRTLYTNVNTTLDLVETPKGGVWVCKRNVSRQRKTQFEHEFVIGYHCLNRLARQIPNFMYTYALAERNQALLIEYIPGKTLFDYIRGPDFTLQNWSFYMLQLFLAIGVAQRTCFFTHHDLCPWNVILRTHPEESVVDYFVRPGKTYRVFTYCTPVIVDFDKTHVVHELQTFQSVHGYSSYQDVICLLVSGLYNILLHRKKLSLTDQNQLLAIFQGTLTDPIYCPLERVQTIDDLFAFLKQAHRYAHISFVSKGGLEERSVEHVIDFFLAFIRPTFTARCERVESFEFRHLRNVRFEALQSIFHSGLNELHPLFARYWKQVFAVWFEDDDEDVPIKDTIHSILLPALDLVGEHRLGLVSPLYLDMFNVFLELYAYSGAHALDPQEKRCIESYSQHYDETRAKILEYSKRVTKIKLTRNIL